MTYRNRSPSGATNVSFKWTPVSKIQLRMSHRLSPLGGLLLRCHSSDSLVDHRLVDIAPFRFNLRLGAVVEVVNRWVHGRTSSSAISSMSGGPVILGSSAR